MRYPGSDLRNIATTKQFAEAVALLTKEKLNEEGYPTVRTI